MSTIVAQLGASHNVGAGVLGASTGLAKRGERERDTGRVAEIVPACR